MEIIEKSRDKATTKKLSKNITGVTVCASKEIVQSKTEETNAEIILKSIGQTLTDVGIMEVSKKNPKTPVIMETISISDGEDSPTTTAAPIDMITKKRKSVGSKDGEEERYRLKRRKIKVAGAPKMPLTGYVRYMNDRREELKKEQPNKTAMEHTKLIGEEWNRLSEDRKAPYMTAAELDKQRYLTELHVFLKARPDVLACELAKNKPRKSTGGTVEPSDKTIEKDKASETGNDANKDAKESKDELAVSASATKARAVMHTRRLSVNYAMPTYLSNESPPAAAPPEATDKIKQSSGSTGISNYKEGSPTPTSSAPLAKRKRWPSPISNTQYNITAAALSLPLPGEIPIFTNEFLEHNKAFDMELRTLRKSKADLEQQNAVLEKHVENMKFGVQKMENENDELQEKNRLLEIYLEKLKRKLANAFSGLAIPSEPQGATLENIEKYMNDLYKMSTSNTHGPASLNKAKDIIRKLDLQIQL